MATASHYPALGTPIEELDTPALCIDLDKLEANIQHMAKLCKEHGVDWRPHSKVHKCPQVARLELEAGAIGVTCAKLGEAEIMVAGGVPDVLIANQIVGPKKVQRLVELARIGRPIVALDDLAQAEPISAAAAEAGIQVRTIIEVDIGLQRAGVLPGEPSLELARKFHALPGIQFEGIMGYEGHLLILADQQEKQQKIEEAMRVLVGVRDLLLANDIPCPIVSAGGTGSYNFTMQCPGVTELQAGGLIFMDNFYRGVCKVQEFEFAMKLLTTVVSRPAADRAIIDSGRKTHNMDIAPSTVIGRDDITVARLSAEHGWLELEPSAQDLKVGDRLELIPGYTDFTCVLHNEFYVLRNNRLEAVWPLAGRGRLQ